MILFPLPKSMEYMMHDNANEQRKAFDKARTTTDAPEQPNPMDGYSEEPAHTEAAPLTPMAKE